ncbi:MAG: hypothetical protein A2481_01815 [Candidatus Yonathbacteria bacterium RIFOXYC2_FULL_47_9]|nr:MAG: hypothetical protein A2481_01815 [Candidatus Yonathbacteria bacterium RIFOXYC2_FULL_47_9]HAT68604.1 hypothetical protein [Candidatus Yonathbacteria bacterium]
MDIEQNNFKRTLRAEVTLLAIFILAFGARVFGVIPEEFETEIIGVIAFVGLIPVAKSALESLREKRINVDLLATIALFFSFITQEWISVLFINMMLSAARILEIYTKRRVHNSLKSLAKIKPMFARVIRAEETIDVPISEVRIGDLALVNLGEQIPVDGYITKGSATVDQSSLTGESVPVLKTEGDKVLSATVVVSGNITVYTEKVGAETTFERMIKLVESSQSAKSRIKTLAERFASWYIGVMLVVSMVTYAITGDTRLVLAIVLVVCADDIAIAIPLAYVAAIGTAARRGIIIKSADFLEQAAKITTLIVDKTGTLTMGHLVVRNSHSWGETPLPQVVQMCGGLCNRSTHPVAKAILRYALENNINCSTSVDVTEVEGRGIIGISEGNKVVLGRHEFLHEQGVTMSDDVERTIAEEELRGNNATLIALNGEIVGLFALADEVREGVAETITALEKSGVKETIMLTGDNAGVAKAIAERTGIDKYYPSLLPENKVSILAKYLGHGRTVAMIGDGVNDAAVLTRSDVGIAMGGIGSDAAIDSADIVLMKDDFPKLLELRSIAHKVIAVVHQNFIIWAIVNTIGLYFVFTGVFDPSRAAAYNFLTDFIPIANALRLYRYR